MRIAVTADIHLAANHPERYNALENILEQVEAENIEILLIAGDLFDKNFHNYAEFERLCKKHSQIQLHIIPGNHDAGINEKNIVGSNIHIYTDPTPVELGSTTFLFVPYEKKAKMGEKIASRGNEIKAKDWVLIGHGDYYGGTRELNPLEPGTYMPLSRENVELFTPQAVLLGHIHKPVDLGDNVYYIGSPRALDISETGKRKFLFYDTRDGSVTRMAVETDVVYFDESFVIVPLDNEVLLLKQEISNRIESWNMDRSDYSKVTVRVKAIGYAMDRSAISSVLLENFDRFKYYEDERPSIEELSMSVDQQLDAIAKQTMEFIDKLGWNFGGDEPEIELVKVEALKVIYESGAR